MTLMPLLLRPASQVLDRLRSWPAGSQQRARRNAMIASTACAQRRHDREDAADYLASRHRPVTPVQHPAVPPPARAHG